MKNDASLLFPTNGCDTIAIAQHILKLGFRVAWAQWTRFVVIDSIKHFRFKLFLFQWVPPTKKSAWDRQIAVLSLPQRITQLGYLDLGQLNFLRGTPGKRLQLSFNMKLFIESLLEFFMQTRTMCFQIITRIVKHVFKTCPTPSETIKIDTCEQKCKI